MVLETVTAQRPFETKFQISRWRGADPEIPNSCSPDSRFGRETGRESPIPDSESAGIGKQGIPVSLFGREREPGSRLAANREIGDAPMCEYSMHDPGPQRRLEGLSLPLDWAARHVG